jgi:hypothetical protein
LKMARNLTHQPSTVELRGLALDQHHSFCNNKSHLTMMERLTSTLLLLVALSLGLASATSHEHDGDVASLRGRTGRLLPGFFEPFDARKHHHGVQLPIPGTQAPSISAAPTPSKSPTVPKGAIQLTLPKSKAPTTAPPSKGPAPSKSPTPKGGSKGLTLPPTVTKGTPPPAVGAIGPISKMTVQAPLLPSSGSSTSYGK